MKSITTCRRTAKLFLILTSILVAMLLMFTSCVTIKPTVTPEQAPSTDFYLVPSREESLKYELITTHPEGNEASSSILPHQHCSVVLFVEKKLTSEINVYCTFIPSEGIADTIYVKYFKPSQRGDPNNLGVTIGYNRTSFALLAQQGY